MDWEYICLPNQVRTIGLKHLNPILCPPKYGSKKDQSIGKAQGFSSEKGGGDVKSSDSSYHVPNPSREYEGYVKVTLSILGGLWSLFECDKPVPAKNMLDNHVGINSWVQVDHRKKTPDLSVHEDLVWLDIEGPLFAWSRKYRLDKNRYKWGRSAEIEESNYYYSSGRQNLFKSGSKENKYTRMRNEEEGERSKEAVEENLDDVVFVHPGDKNNEINLNDLTEMEDWISVQKSKSQIGRLKIPILSEENKVPPRASVFMMRLDWLCVECGVNITGRPGSLVNSLEKFWKVNGASMLEKNILIAWGIRCLAIEDERGSWGYRVISSYRASFKSGFGVSFADDSLWFRCYQRSWDKIDFSFSCYGSILEFDLKEVQVLMSLWIMIFMSYCSNVVGHGHL
ncbi:hypothetical protein Tco_1163420 [Tanacetum coccineum]